MPSRTFLMPLLALSLLIGAPSAARAQFFITPYVGSSFASSVDDYDFGSKLHYGVALDWLSSSGLGFEVDFGYSPTFFEPGEDEFLEFESDGNITTLMGNIVFGGLSGVYLSGGMGLMRSNIRSVGGLFEDLSDNGLGWNGGGGLRIGGDKFAIRGDLRYFRQFDDLGSIDDINIDLGSLSFWRAAAGVSFGF
jgi:hypothetical protein